MSEAYVKYFDQSYVDTDLVNSPLCFSVPSKRIRHALENIVRNAKGIMDVGCGPGSTLKLFHRLNNNARLIGADFSQVALDKSRRVVEGASQLEVFRVNFDSDPLPAVPVDLIYCSQVIEHLQDDQSFVSRMFEVSKPGCHVVLCTVFKKPYARYIYRNAKGEQVLEPTHVREYKDRESLLDLFRHAGFEVLDCDLSRMMYPAIDIPLKIVTKHFKNALVWKTVNSRFVVFLRKISRIPIPGYFNIQVVARRPSV